MKSKLFLGQTICLDFSISTSYKLKKNLIDVIINNGGRVSFILNKKCNYLIKNDTSNLDTHKCRTAFRMGIPVLDLNFINDYFFNTPNKTKCIKINDYFIKNINNDTSFEKGVIPKSKLKIIQPIQL